MLSETKMKQTLFIVFTIIISLSITPGYPFNSISMNERFLLSQDTLRPTIEYWNISATVYQGLDFEVSAYVWDTGSGVENVSLRILNSTSFEWLFELSFNGSHYMAMIPALQLGDTYRLSILAFDKAGNSATSYTRHIDLTHTTTSVPESATFPIVVASSLVFMFIVIIIAWAIKKQQSEIG